MFSVERVEESYLNTDIENMPGLVKSQRLINEDAHNAVTPEDKEKAGLKRDADLNKEDANFRTILMNPDKLRDKLSTNKKTIEVKSPELDGNGDIIDDGTFHNYKSLMSRPFKQVLKIASDYDIKGITSKDKLAKSILKCQKEMHG